VTPFFACAIWLDAVLAAIKLVAFLAVTKILRGLEILIRTLGPALFGTT
jgi:hypothetical protein